MITKHNNRSLALGISGLCLQIGSLIALFLVPGPGWIGTFVGLAMIMGQILLIAGFCYYAVAKGYSVILGLVGLFSLLGLLVIWWLPDQSKAEGS